MIDRIRAMCVCCLFVSACSTGSAFDKGEVAYAKGNYTEASKWYAVAAEEGDANGQVKLGMMYHEGQGVSQDYAESIKWFEKAADQDNAIAQCKPGAALMQNPPGFFGYVPDEIIMTLLRRSAEQGYPIAQRIMGVVYAKQENQEEAAKWFRLAAQQGESLAISYLARMYFEGVGVEKDEWESLRLRMQNAEGGDPGSQAVLGEVYLLGFDGQLRHEAMPWFLKASECGWPISNLYRVCTMYAGGAGALKDYV